MLDELDFDTAGVNHGELHDRHRQMSAVKHNANPFSIDFRGDLDAEEEAVWRIVEAFEPKLRASVTARYASHADATRPEVLQTQRHVPAAARATGALGTPRVS
jgi:hypothetical protein